MFKKKVKLKGVDPWRAGESSGTRGRGKNQERMNSVIGRNKIDPEERTKRRGEETDVKKLEGSGPNTKQRVKGSSEGYKSHIDEQESRREADMMPIVGGAINYKAKKGSREVREQKKKRRQKNVNLF